MALKQLPALVQVAVDALMHGVEGARHLHQFAGAALLQRCRRTAQGQVAGGARQALERTALPMHQQTGEKQQQQAGENDREHLLRLQSLGFQADVRRRHQAGDVQPLAFADADLGHQHRRVHRLQGQRVVRPGTRQLVELQRAVEQAQLVGTDEFDLQLDLLAQALVQHVLDDLQHRLLVRRVRQGTHLQRPVVQRDEEARTAHAAQLVEHQRTVAERQGTEVADAGRHRVGQAARAGEQALALAGAQVRQPEQAGKPLRDQHREQGQEQHAPEQRARHRRPAPPFAHGCRCGRTCAASR